jgi:hypothetical protein
MSSVCLPSPAAERKRAAVAVPSHWAGLDAARWIAAYAIVALHALRSPALEPWRVLARFAVPFFVAACVLLVLEGVRRHPQRTVAQYARGRFVRIYLPFLAWSAVYLAFKMVKGRLLPEQPNDYPGWNILWMGAFYHLWFMPFILVVSLLACLVGKATAGDQRRRRGAAAPAALAGLLLALPPVATALARHGEYAQLVFGAAPAALLAVAIGCACRRGAPCLPLPLAVLFFAASLLSLWIFGRGVLLENVAGVSLLLLALRPAAEEKGISPIFATFLHRVAQLPPLAYGIYLSHLLPIKVCEACAAKLHLPVDGKLDLAVFLISVVASTALAWGLYKLRPLRWLVA